jgi:excisionase family DNA binding protein
MNRERPRNSPEESRHSRQKAPEEPRHSDREYVLGAHRVSRRLGITSETLRLLVKQGQIDARWLRGRWRFHAAEVRLFAACGPRIQRVGAAAKTAGVHPRTILRWVARGLLRSPRSRGGHHLFLRDDLLSVPSTPSRRRVAPLQATASPTPKAKGPIRRTAPSS